MAATNGQVKFTYISAAQKATYFAKDGQGSYTGALANGVTSIDNTHVVFIGDTGELWAQGNFYGFTPEERSIISSNFNTLDARISSYVNGIDNTATGSQSKTITGAELVDTTGGGKSLKFTYSNIGLTIGASATSTSATGATVVKSISQGDANGNGIKYTTGTLGAGDIAYSYANAQGNPTVASALQELFAWQSSAVDQHLAGVRNVWASAATVTQSGTAQATNISDTRANAYQYSFVEFKVEKASGTYDYLYLKSEDLLNSIEGSTGDAKDELNVTIDTTSGKNIVKTSVGSNGLKATSSYIGTAQTAGTDYYSTIAADTNVETAIDTLNKAIKTVNTYVTGAVKSVDGKTPNASGAVNLSIPTAISGGTAANTQASTAYTQINAGVSYYNAIVALDKAIMKVAQSTAAYTNAVTSVDGKTGAVSLTTTAITGSIIPELATTEATYMEIASTSYQHAIEQLDRAIQYAYTGNKEYTDAKVSEATAALSWNILS